jgi:hypothetical protein
MYLSLVVPKMRCVGYYNRDSSIIRIVREISTYRYYKRCIVPVVDFIVVS